jgi:hypothetical protein
LFGIISLEKNEHKTRNQRLRKERTDPYHRAWYTVPQEPEKKQLKVKKKTYSTPMPDHIESMSF